MELLLSKILLGISLAAPVGPVSIEVIKRGLSRGFRSAAVIGVGSAFGDAVYLFVTYFGLYPFLANPLTRVVICSIGAAILLYLGMQSIRDSKNMKWLEDSEDFSTRDGFLLGASLALINPFTAVWWLGVFGGMLGSSTEDAFTPMAFMMNTTILLGVLIWFIGLSAVLSVGKQFVTRERLKIVSVLSGLCLIGFGFKYGFNAATMFVEWLNSST
jgi:L-lysine exporter family protein LysE/ArgO